MDDSPVGKGHADTVQIINVDQVIVCNGAKALSKARPAGIITLLQPDKQRISPRRREVCEAVTKGGPGRQVRHKVG